MGNNYLLYFVQTSKNYKLERGDVIIAGKSRDNSTLHLVPTYFQGPIQTISRSHFQLSYNNYGLFIEDLASKNGTEVNGKLLSPKERTRLSHGDTIRIAKNDDFVIKVIDEDEGTGLISPLEPGPPAIPPHGLYLHEDENTFYLDGKAINGFSSSATELLKYLYKYKKRTCSYSDIIKDLATTKPSIRTTIKHIRAKFEEVLPGSKMRYLKTVHGYGYKLLTE